MSLDRPDNSFGSDILWELRLKKLLYDEGVSIHSKQSMSMINRMVDEGEPYPASWKCVLGDDYEYIEVKKIKEHDNERNK